MTRGQCNLTLLAVASFILATSAEVAKPIEEHARRDQSALTSNSALTSRLWLVLLGCPSPAQAPSKVGAGPAELIQQVGAGPLRE